MARVVNPSAICRARAAFRRRQAPDCSGISPPQAPRSTSSQSISVCLAAPPWSPALDDHGKIILLLCWEAVHLDLYRLRANIGLILEGKPLWSRYISVSLGLSRTTPSFIRPLQRPPERSVARSDAISRGSPQAQDRSEYRSLAVIRNAHTA